MIITSPEISKKTNISVGGNYYFSLIIDENVVKICFPLCSASMLQCFGISGLINGSEGMKPGWVNNHFSNGEIEIIIPPDRPGFFISKKGKFSVASSESRVFWPIVHKVMSFRSPWNVNPAFYSEVAGKLPAIAFTDAESGTIITIGDIPDRSVLLGISMKREGIDRLRYETDKFLQRLNTYGEAESIKANALLSIFLSNSKCIDTSGNCILASKSPYYYVSAGYWARDFVFWVLPVLEKIDPYRAKELIAEILTKYWTNKGVHALYLDGRILYNGFELDQLAYHFLVLSRSVKYGIISSQKAVNLSRELTLLLENFKSDRFQLYRTDLNSSDDPVEYPYVTYSNVALWYSIRYFSESIDNQNREDLLAVAEEIKRDVNSCMVKEGMYVYSNDLKEHYNFYDDPTGSLLLLPYLGFIRRSDIVFKKTAKWISSNKNEYYISGKYGGVGNMHVKHPWLHSFYSMMLSSLSNSSLLEQLPMNYGLACETIDENNGECLTGIHFPGSSGMYVQAILKTLGYDRAFKSQR